NAMRQGKLNSATCVIVNGSVASGACLPAFTWARCSVDKTIRNSTAAIHALIAAPRLGFWGECYSINRCRDRFVVPANERCRETHGRLFRYVIQKPLWRCKADITRLAFEARIE